MQSTMSSEEADQIARAVSRVLQSRVQGKKGERCRQQWPVLEQGQGARGKEQGRKEDAGRCQGAKGKTHKVTRRRWLGLK